MIKIRAVIESHFESSCDRTISRSCRAYVSRRLRFHEMTCLCKMGNSLEFIIFTVFAPLHSTPLRVSARPCDHFAALGCVTFPSDVANFTKHHEPSHHAQSSCKANMIDDDVLNAACNMLAFWRQSIRPALRNRLTNKHANIGRHSSAFLEREHCRYRTVCRMVVKIVKIVKGDKQ